MKKFIFTSLASTAIALRTDTKVAALADLKNEVRADLDVEFLGLNKKAFKNLSQSYDFDMKDLDLSFSEMCETNGFRFESYEVTTEDGYILTIFRIPGLIGEDDETV